MPRRPRDAQGGVIYHVLNRRVGRERVFFTDDDYLAFLRVLRGANQRETKQDRPPVEVFSLCLMPNHWHLLVRPTADGQLSPWMRWLQITHTQRYRVAHGTAGEGPLYQGRFKSHPVVEPQAGDAADFRAVAAYVEGNAVRAGLVDDAADWPWGSLAMRSRYGETVGGLLAPPPVPWPEDWREMVNRTAMERRAEKGSGVAGGRVPPGRKSSGGDY